MLGEYDLVAGGPSQPGKRLTLPPLRHAVGDAGVLVAGEAEADEPLAVELARRLLQQPHPSPVVLDQVVVAPERTCDPQLNT